MGRGELTTGTVGLCFGPPGRWGYVSATGTVGHRDGGAMFQPPGRWGYVSATGTVGLCSGILLQSLMESLNTTSQSIWTLVLRAGRLRCPACGRAKMFRNMLSMNDPCPECGRKFDRAPGYLLGSIYVNYGLTAVLVVILYFGMFLTTDLTGKQLLYVTSAFALLFPLWFFRYARALWIALDEKFDPWPNEHEARELANRKSNR